MSEPNYAYRIPPCSKYDIAGMESWLEDLARQGLFLERDGLFLGFATFVRGEPEELRFRLEATDKPGGLFSPTHDPADDILDLHYRMGWHYRGRWGQFHIFATADPNAPELHTDPRVQALTIAALNKFQRTQLWGFLWYTLIMYYFHGSMLFSLTAIWGLGKTAVALLWLLSFPVVELYHLTKMMKLKSQLKKGIPMSHRANYRPMGKAIYAGRLARWCAGIFLVFALMGLFSESILEEQAVDLEDWNQPLPFPRVEELYPGAEIESGSFIQNRVTHWSNWITPENYDFTQWSDITMPDGERTTAYLRIYCHESRFDWFARMLAREYANNQAGSFYDRLFSDSQAPEAMEGVDADYAVTFYHNNAGIVLCKGNTVIMIRYSREVGSHFSPEELAEVYLSGFQGEEESS